MATQYTSILKLALPVTGELSGTWGDVVNNNITSMVEQAIAGLSTINTWTANAHTLTVADGTTSESRCAMLVAATGTGGTALTAAGEIICPAASKLYVLKNGAAYAVTLKTAAGTGVAVPAGDTAFLFCDGTNVNACVTTIVNGHISGNLTVDGNTTLGDANTDTVTVTAQFASDLLPSTDNARDLGSTAKSWRTLYCDTSVLVGNLSLAGNTLSSTDTNGNIVIAPNGTGDVQLDADTVRVGDSNANATITTNGTGDLILNTNAGTNSGSITIEDGVNGNIIIAPNGTGQVQITNAALDLTTIEVSNINAKDGTAAITIADSTGAVTVSSAFAANGGATLGDASGDALTINSSAVSTPNGLNFDSNTFVIDATNNRVGINNASPTVALDVTGALTISGNAILGDASTDTVLVNGYMAVGGALNSGIAVRIGSSALGGATQRGAYADVTFTSASTTRGAAFESNPSTAVASFTVTDVMGFSAQNVATLGAGSTITNQHGVYVNDQTRGTNNFGVTSLVSSGANKWNIYASGTAANYFAGNVGIGTTSPDYKLQVSGTTGQTFSIERVASAIGSSTSLGTIVGTGEIPTLTADGASIQFLGAGTWSATSAPGRIVFNTTPAATTTPVERFQLTTGEAVVNDPGNDYDFRVESDTNTHAFFVQGSDGNVGIGTSSPAVKLDVSSATGSASPTPTEIRIATTSNASDWSTTLPWGRLSFYNADSSGTGPKIHASIDTTSAAASGALSVLSFSTNISSTNDLIERLRFQSNEAVFNDPGNDYDFRVESDTNTHALFVEGSNGFVGVGTSSPGGVFHTVATAAGAASIGGILQNADNSLNSEVRLLFAPNLSTNWGNRQAYISGVNVVGGGTATELAFGSAANGVAPVERMRIDKDGNVRVGTAALATTATNGFLYIPTCAGTPTGTPTAITGLAPMVIDSTNNKLYIYSGGAWVALN